MIFAKKPFRISFSGNPMRYQLSSSGGGGGGGGLEQLSIVEIEFTNIDPVPDHSISINMMGDSRTFTLKSEPSTRDHLPAADDAWSALRWCQECYSYVLNDVSLVSAYEITLDGSKIILTARTASPDFDWTTSGNSITGVTVTTTQVGQAAASQTVDGVRLQVWKSGTEKIGEDYKALDAAGSVKFEIQEYIYSNQLLNIIPRFGLTGAQFFHNVYTDFFLKYKTLFCNKVSGVFEDRSYTDPDFLFCYALPGGLSREDLVANNQASTDYFGLAGTKQKFLTWAPPSRMTDKAESHSLFFALQDPSYTTIQLKAHVYSGDTGSTVSITPAIMVQHWTVVEFMAGYTQIGLGNLMNGNVDRWQLYLVDNNGTVISDIREFSLDKSYHENVRYFRFRNSWGAYDSLRCTGVFENFVEHDREKVMFRNEDTETMFNTPGGYSFIREAQNFKANSGWLTRDGLNYLRDFMLSGEIYELDGTRLLRCLLTSKKTSLFKDALYNYNLLFEYERAWDDFFFQGSE
jgi:hypothetical protein